MDNARMEALFSGAEGVAFFVDLENLVRGIEGEGLPNPLSKAADLVLALRESLRSEKIPLLVGRAYGLWDSPPSALVSRKFQKAGITPVHMLLVRGKNSVDIKLAIDAVETFFSNPKVTHFVIFSGDRDFMPLATRIREGGKEVIIVGSPSALSNDLLELVGETNYISHRELLEMPERVTAGVSHTSNGGDSPPFKERVYALLEEAQRTKGPEIWISPFIQNEGARFLPSATSSDFRDAFDCLVEEGRIRIEKRIDKFDPSKHYSVIIITPRTGTMAAALRGIGLAI